MRIKELLVENIQLRIDKEYSDYKEKMLLKETNELFEKAYEIDYISRTHLILRERLEHYDESKLEKLYAYSNILMDCYFAWLKAEDSSEVELLNFVVAYLENICKG